MYESVYGIAHACMYIFMYVCMRACRQVCVSTYTDTYTYQYLYMYQIRWCIYCGRHNLDEPRSKLDTHGASFSCAAFRARSMRPFATTLPHRESLRLSARLHYCRHESDSWDSHTLSNAPLCQTGIFYIVLVVKLLSLLLQHNIICCETVRSLGWSHG